MASKTKMEREPQKKTGRDTIETLLGLLGKIRRRASRLDSLGLLPEEVSTRVFGHILSMEEDLKWLKQEKS